MILLFTLIAVIFCHTIPKNLCFPYFRQYHSTSSLLNNHDTESYSNILSKLPQNDSDTPFVSFSLHTSNETIAQHEMNSRSPFNIRNLPSSVPLNDNLDNTFDSTDSDFETPRNPIYHSTSSSTPTFPQFYPRLGDSPSLPFQSSPDSQTYPLVIDLLIHHIIHALFHKKITKTQNPLLASSPSYKFTLLLRCLSESSWNVICLDI